MPTPADLLRAAALRKEAERQRDEAALAETVARQLSLETDREACLAQAQTLRASAEQLEAMARLSEQPAAVRRA